ncbi:MULTISPECIES: hypothetical protein [unclassified Streptomyces]|uniref:hypothetical protein n=1 Tax=unclassified Streptomyces TaxID=2593676 RepID=UPI0029B47BE2|nr:MULTISPECIES: hypothetical protein [unclassified Streptomyces]MDX3766367.1 hypothetical protein [Streptomyces sp. AK08-01B]MDX3816377.1 hypothetical protein [Streptomyces sp. AK08-01A]
MAHGDVREGNQESVFSREFLLTTASLYWFTRSAPTTTRIYTANQHMAPLLDDELPVTRAPMGFSVSPHEMILLPRKVMEHYADLQHWAVQPRGGHFAPAEQEAQPRSRLTTTCAPPPLPPFAGSATQFAH